MQLDHKGYWIAAWIVAIVQAVITIYVLFLGRWTEAAVFAGALAASLVAIMARQRLPELFALLFVIAILFNSMGWLWGYYHTIWPYDEILHGYTMCVIALALAFFIHYFHGREHEPGVGFVLIVTALSLVLGVAWEIIEWLFNIMGTMHDTITDVIADVIGGLIAGLFGAWAIRTNPPRQLRD